MTTGTVWHTAATAAERFGVAEATVRQAVIDGALAAYPVGKRGSRQAVKLSNALDYRLRESDVDEWMASAVRRDLDEVRQNDAADDWIRSRMDLTGLMNGNVTTLSHIETDTGTTRLVRFNWANSDAAQGLHVHVAHSSLGGTRDVFFVAPETVAALANHMGVDVQRMKVVLEVGSWRG